MKRSSISTDKSGGREVSAGDSSTTDRAVEAASRRQNQEVATLTNNARNLQSYSEEWSLRSGWDYHNSEQAAQINVEIGVDKELKHS